MEAITYVKNLPNFILERYNACRLGRMKPVEMQVLPTASPYCEEHSASRKCPICGKDLVLRETDTPVLRLLRLSERLPLYRTGIVTV